MYEMMFLVYTYMIWILARMLSETIHFFDNTLAHSYIQRMLSPDQG